MDKVIIYSAGTVCCSVCVDKYLSNEEIEQLVNIQLPTGIYSQWVISKDIKFKDGKPHPCQCDQHPETRMHYLLNC